jgi:nicotinamidase-related amidase
VPDRNGPSSSSCCTKITGTRAARARQLSELILSITAPTPNSFHRTDLQKLLYERGVERLVICGLQTEYCVDTTLRQALSLGYRVVLASDAHSTVDGVLMAAQIIAHHNHTFRNMNSFGPLIEVKPTAEVTFDA